MRCVAVRYAVCDVKGRHKHVKINVSTLQVVEGFLTA